MANTEGLTDEVVSSMLAMPSPDEERQLHCRRHQHTRFPQSAMARREQMMESLGEGEMPAARVIRTSKAPVIQSSSALRSRTQNNGIKEPITPTPTAERTQQNEDRDLPRNNSVANKNSHRPVILSDSIRERPVELNTNIIKAATAQPRKRESRFKQQQLRKDGSTNPTMGGFPSLDFAPVGSLTRKGRSARVQNSLSAVSNQKNSPTIQSAAQHSTTINPSTTSQTTIDVGTTTESMLANMSIEEIRDGVEEVKSILSAESIAFLRERGKQKQQEKVIKQKEAPVREIIAIQNEAGPSLTKEMELELEEKKIREGKEKVAELLSKIRTPEDMDHAYNEAIELGLAPSLPTSSLEATVGVHSFDERNSKLYTATSLLRSTSFRQRLLGARSVCNILEEDVKTILDKRQRNYFSISSDDRIPLQKAYPPLLPVAIRCILDESLAMAHTSGGMTLLSQGLRSIHCLMKLFVHPYHLVDVNPSTIGVRDPFELYATCFMSEISHVPTGAELYPPTKITPIEKSGTNGSCYRADSSAASAESDSKVFYSDPSWILLSRMRILPCLSDVITSLSKHVSSGGRVQVSALQSVCGILAMLAVRSPGAALAIANHKGLLPFLSMYCLSPRSDEICALFGTQNVLPFLILLCTLARQSKDVARLEMPFDTIMPHLQGILCFQAEKEDELQIQMWSLVLVRILVRYGLATEHVQFLISIAAPYVAVQKPQNKICVHFLSLFACICDASNVIQRQNDGQLSSTSEQDNSLSMSAVWLSSSVKSCTTMLPALLRDCRSDDTVSVLEMASSQLRFLASFTNAAKQSVATTLVPILSQESCRSVIDSVLGQSDLLKYSLEISLGWSYRASWLEMDVKSRTICLEQEAIACAYVISFMDLVMHFATDDMIAQKLRGVVLRALSDVRSKHEKHVHTGGNSVHVARQSWFIEAEYSVLKYLSNIEAKENDRSLISAFAVSLVGRLNVGHEAIAYFVFGQKALFMATCNQDDCTYLFRSLFLGELSLTSKDRKAQLEQSDKLFNKGPLNSLRCTADFSAATSTRGDRFFLPVGTTWLWNVLSSTITPDEAYGEDRGVKNATDIVVGALSLLVQLETSCPLQINEGTKLYHLCNVCLLPEEILRDDVIMVHVNLLFNQLQFNCKELNDSMVVRDFIRECFQHSRLSRVKKSDEDEPTVSLAAEPLLLDDEARALDDFVGDICESFIEYGGQYVVCTRFMRFFLWHDFPVKITKFVLEKLQPILNVLSVEGESTESLQFSLAQSINGGLPSRDSSPRDSSARLDVFAATLKKTNKLIRTDYFYMLAISYLSRNLASSLQRCECGLEAMKNRLAGVTSATFYDVVLTSKQLLCDNVCTKESLVGCVIDRCQDDSADLQRQDTETQQFWHWSQSDETVTWKRAVDFLEASKGD